jgi:hypothetical protein
VPQVFELFTKRAEIVEFAVEDNYEPSIGRLNRLAATREVNDRQSGVAQSDVHFWRQPSPVSVRTSMRKTGGHRREYCRRISVIVNIIEAADSAHLNGLKQLKLNLY